MIKLVLPGQLNEYGLLKDAAKKKLEGGAGLDTQADFDEYTIYDQGQLNEYGLLKDAARKKLEGGAGLDTTADFDEYTIYDQGPMNEYGVLKAERWIYCLQIKVNTVFSFLSPYYDCWI